MAKILIVDDEPRIRQLITEYLEHEGFECAEATDGSAALASLYGDAALQRAEDLLSRRERFFGIAMPGIELDGCEMHHRLLAAYDKVHRLHLKQSAKASPKAETP